MHLSQISTKWTVLFDAHQGETDAVAIAQQRLLQRYQRAVLRYLYAMLRDWDAADDLFQEFAVRLLRGSFKNANPERGRFRDFLKSALRNLVINRWRRQGDRSRSLPEGVEPSVEETPGAEADQEFITQWRDELLARTFETLQRVERQTGQPFYTVLRFRTDHPEMRSPEMAEKLSTLLGKKVSPEWVRKRLHFAREKFTDLLLDEVAESLGTPTLDELEEEVIDLGLQDHCRAALERRRQQ